MTIPQSIARVQGPNLSLRLVTPADAEYIHALRTNPTYNQHLSPVIGDVEDQRRWIKGYKAREAELRELYYMIECRDGTRCGLVRLYDIGVESFTWGSWILDHNKTRKAALESAVLSFGVGFKNLGIPQAMVDVRKGNIRALEIYRSLGMIELKRDEKDVFLTYLYSRFEADRAGYMAVLEEVRAG